MSSEKLQVPSAPKASKSSPANIEDPSKNPPPQETSNTRVETFAWRSVGYWDSKSFTDKVRVLKILKAIEAYILDHCYGDWYWNCSLMIGTCFFAWLLGHFSKSILSLLVVLLFTNSVYRLEFRRFNRNIRDDMARARAIKRLDTKVETMEWLNSFLDKFWVIYMTAFSETVLYQANSVLKEQPAPGFGIEGVSLEEFTLGSKAPRINSIQSFTRKGDDLIEMVWAFLFAPTDTDDMTKNEIKKKINPKVALGITIGKAFISKSMPVLVENMSFTGRLNVRVKLSENFPHVKMVSIQFLEAPKIDYALKPVGGDTFGIDIMSFIPGLASFVNGLINANLRPMLYAPNSLDIDIEEIMATQLRDASGVVAVTIRRCTDLRTGNKSQLEIIPYVQLTLSGNAYIDERTVAKQNTDCPVFLETKYLLVDRLEGNHLYFNVFNLVKNKADDQLIGRKDLVMADLLQTPVTLGAVEYLTEGGRKVGKIEYDIRYFPQLEPLVLDDGTKEVVTDSEVGIMKINLHLAINLDISQTVTGVLNPYAEIYVNHELVKSCRRLRQQNEPNWEELFESLIILQSRTLIMVIVKDSVEDNIVGKLEKNLQDLVFESGRGNLWLQASPVRAGTGEGAKFSISALWKPLAIDDDAVVKSYYSAPIGGLKVEIRSARGLKNLESVGLVDPYLRLTMSGRVRGRTPTIADTVNPNWNSVFYLPVNNEHQHFLLEIMDKEWEGKDRLLGLAAVNVEEFIKKDKGGQLLGYDGSEEIIEQPVLLSGQQHGTLRYSVSFFPTIPTFTKTEIEHMDEFLADQKAEAEEVRRKEEAEAKLYEKYPNKYEWIDVVEDTLPEPVKKELTLNEVLEFRCGVIAVHIGEGRFLAPDVFVQILFDDQASPSGISSRSEGRNLKAFSTGELFIRDLPNSKMIVRVTKRVDVTSEKSVVAERTLDTCLVIKDSFTQPITINVDHRNHVTLQAEYIPLNVTLAPLDTVLDVGYMTLDIMNAQNLPSADSNGKSDPFLKVTLDGVEVFRTGKKRRTLNPVWNESIEFPMLSRSRQVLMLEVFDWDLTHKAELISRARIDLSDIEPNATTEFEAHLTPQGTVMLQATFKPEYVRPKLGGESGLAIDLDAIKSVPFKAVGGVTHLAGNILGTGVGIASDSLSVGTNLFKKLGKPRKSIETRRSLGERGSPALSPQPSARPSVDERGAPGETPPPQDGESQIDLLASNLPDELPRDLTDGSTRKLELRERRFNWHRHLAEGDARHEDALPALVDDELPPLQKPGVIGHVRELSLTSGASAMSRNSRAKANSITSTAMSEATGSVANTTSGSIAGRVGVILCMGLLGQNLMVKVKLEMNEKKVRTVLKTRPLNKEKESGAYMWNENAQFLADPEAELVFTVLRRHSLVADTKVANARISLKEYESTVGNIVLDLNKDAKLMVTLDYVPA